MERGLSQFDVDPKSGNDFLHHANSDVSADSKPRYLYFHRFSEQHRRGNVRSFDRS